jgi:hypothetical protein
MVAMSLLLAGAKAAPRLQTIRFRARNTYISRWPKQ